MKMQKNLLGLLAKASKGTAMKETNGACIIWAYQPKMPQALKEAKKCK